MTTCNVCGKTMGYSEVHRTKGQLRLECRVCQDLMDTIRVRVRYSPKLAQKVARMEAREGPKRIERERREAPVCRTDKFMEQLEKELDAQSSPFGDDSKAQARQSAASQIEALRKADEEALQLPLMGEGPVVHEEPEKVDKEDVARLIDLMGDLLDTIRAAGVLRNAGDYTRYGYARVENARETVRRGLGK